MIKIKLEIEIKIYGVTHDRRECVNKYYLKKLHKIKHHASHNKHDNAQQNDDQTISEESKCMKKQIDLVREFHKKFKVLVSASPSLIPLDRSDNRYRLMKDEVEEYLAGVRNGDIENIAKELVDILYAVYGTVLEHGLQDKIEAIFEEVHRSNMSKDFHEYKMVKGPDYRQADIKKIFQD